MQIIKSPPEEFEHGVPIVAFDHDAVGKSCGYCNCSLSGHFIDPQETGTSIWCRDCSMRTFTDAQGKNRRMGAPCITFVHRWLTLDEDELSQDQLGKDPLTKNSPDQNQDQEPKADLWEVLARATFDYKGLPRPKITGRNF